MIAALTRMAYIPGDAIAGLADGDRPGTGTDVKCAVAAGRFAGRAKEAADWREAIYQQAFEIAGTAQDPLGHQILREPDARPRYTVAARASHSGSAGIPPHARD